MVSYRSVTVYVVVYQPRSKNVYPYPITLFNESNKVYYYALLSFCEKHVVSMKLDLYVIVDFNMPDTNWTTFLLQTIVTTVSTHLANFGLKKVFDVAHK